MEQMQELMYALPVARSEQSDLMVSVIPKNKSPYNLFVNLSQLIDINQNFVYFFVYCSGQKKIALYGIYNKNMQTFSIDGACKYLLDQFNDQLNNMVTTWKNLNFKYMADTTLNRFTPRIDRYLGKEKDIRYEEYVIFKYILAFLDEKMTLTDLNMYYPGAYDKFLNRKPVNISDYQYIENLRWRIEEYEKNINILSVNTQNFLPQDATEQMYRMIINNINIITEKFKYTFETSYFQTMQYYESLSICPNADECHKDFYKEGCNIYYHGEENYLSPEDTKTLL